MAVKLYHRTQRQVYGRNTVGAENFPFSLQDNKILTLEVTERFKKWVWFHQSA